MKIIDFERVGNVVKFFLGDDECKKYWGDDWNDAPYDCNAGTVYDEYIKAEVTVAFPLNIAVSEPKDLRYGYYDSPNCNISKEDMKNEKTPCIVVTSVENIGWSSMFSDVIAVKDCTKFYFNEKFNRKRGKVKGGGVIIKYDEK